MGSIYKITNTVNGKAYIGQTIHDAVKGRINDHLNQTQNGSRMIKRAIKKYGKASFTYEILHDGIIPEFLDDLEIEAITKFNTVAPNGYNLTTGGNSGGLPSEQTRRKISEALKGKPLSEAHRRKISEANTGEKNPQWGRPAWNKGKPCSSETRRKLSEAHKGKTLSEAHRRKHSEALKGKPLSEAHRRKISETLKGRTLSGEHRRKLSETQETPERTAARTLFFSLPPDMALKEKRRLLYKKITGVHRSTIRRWVRQWQSQSGY